MCFFCLRPPQPRIKLKASRLLCDRMSDRGLFPSRKWQVPKSGGTCRFRFGQHVFCSSMLPVHRWLRRPYTTKIEKIIMDNIKVSFSLPCPQTTKKLQSTGPISFATYMQLCLSHPTEGYYTRRSNPIFGSHGDFITSPEMSQVFGEVPFKIPFKNETGKRIYS